MFADHAEKLGEIKGNQKTIMKDTNELKKEVKQMKNDMRENFLTREEIVRVIRAVLYRHENQYHDDEKNIGRCIKKLGGKTKVLIITIISVLGALGVDFAWIPGGVV